MEQPSDSPAALQPQELSTAACSLPRAFDPTRSGDERPLKSNSMEALHVVQPPGWCLGSGASNGSVFPQGETEPPLQPSEQIQPDNALSSTTVTLSYVTRSHVFTADDSLSQHSQIYSVPISKAFSLHPAAYDASQLVTNPGGVPLCVQMDQHCLQQVSVPVGLAACAGSFDFVTPAQVSDDVASLCLLQQAHSFSGVPDVESLALETLRSLQQSGPAECKIPLGLDEIQNVAIGSLWSTGAIDGDFPACHVESIVDQAKNGNPEVLLLISRTDDPVVLPNNGPASLAVSLNSHEFIGAPEDSVSPSLSSLIGVKDVSILPQVASVFQSEHSAGAENTSAGQHESSDVPQTSADAIDWSTTNALNASISSGPTGNTVDMPGTGQCEPSRALSEAEKEATRVQTKSLLGKKKTPERKELPPRTRRGIRLEAIVQNIFPSRYKSSRAKKISDTQPARLRSRRSASFGSDGGSVLEAECPPTVESVTNERTAARLPEEAEEADVTNPSRQSTSWSRTVSEHSPARPALPHKPVTSVEKSKRQHDVSNDSPGRVKKKEEVKKTAVRRCEPTKPSLSQQTLTASSKHLARVKKVRRPKKRRKKHRVGQPSMFSRREPEIKLKYLSCKEEKREKRDDAFSPFVRVELQAYPNCRVINYPDEHARLSQGKWPTSLASGKMPTTPCLHYGRVSTEGARPAALVCCLCGGSANTTDLGDLHGPYYPEGFRPKTRLPANPQEPREDDSSDSDSLRSQTRKPHHKLQAAAPGPCQRWSRDGELSCSRAAKKLRADSLTDWYAPPVVPLEAGEYWLHEDCGIWSAGVFLVRGKLYGLDRAVKTAKQTICSSCHKMGATLGCFYRGCPNKYHYTCAMQSGCVLYEENFSMKCRKHKNKSIKGSSSHKHSSR